MKTFRNVFKEEIWSFSNLNYIKPKHRRTSFWGRQKKVIPEYGSKPNNPNEDYIYRFTGDECLKKFYFVLKNSMLFVYIDHKSAMPDEVIFLEGVFVDVLSN